MVAAHKCLRVGVLVVLEALIQSILYTIKEFGSELTLTTLLSSCQLFAEEKLVHIPQTDPALWKRLLRLSIQTEERTPISSVALFVLGLHVE